jgi:hypothetical protein
MPKIQKMLKFFSHKSQQRNNCFGGIGEEEQKEINKLLQDLDPKDCLHIEEGLIGGKQNPDSSLISLKEMQESLHELRDIKLNNVKNGGVNLHKT